MKKKVIGLIDGQSGNIGSINKAIKEIIKGRPYQLKIIRGEFDYSLFNKIILPGQGAYATLISNLKKLKIYKPLKTYLENNCSYLGICVGMQILSDQGHEERTTKGLGIIAGEIKKFKSKKLIIPHMGWNFARPTKRENLFQQSLCSDARYYFAHSYYAEVTNPEDSLMKTTHSVEFDSAVMRENIMGLQFHPEKSHRFGIELLKKFVNL